MSDFVAGMIAGALAALAVLCGVLLTVLHDVDCACSDCRSRARVGEGTETR